MGFFRFHRSFQILPFVRLNLSKSGLGISLGPKGFRHSIGPRGQRTTVGAGFGLSYIHQHKRSMTKREQRLAKWTPTATIAVFAWLAFLIFAFAWMIHVGSQM